jgi:pimeloyl-ACP methyl ester carboxylesterase
MYVTRPDAALLALSFGHGPLNLVTVGGWIGSGEVWLDVFGHLGSRWRCVTFDHRGTGASACTAERIRIADMVDDLLAVLDAHQMARAVIAAESAGGGVALEAALRAPDRITGLVLVAPAWRRPTPGRHDAFIASLRRDFPGAVAAFVAACLPEAGTADAGTADARRWGRLILERAEPERAVELLECQAELTAEDRLGELSLPVLVLHGDADSVQPLDASRRLTDELADARLVLLEGAGHAPMLSRPRDVAAAIESFVA